MFPPNSSISLISVLYLNFQTSCVTVTAATQPLSDKNFQSPLLLKCHLRDQKYDIIIIAPIFYPSFNVVNPPFLFLSYPLFFSHILLKANMCFFNCCLESTARTIYFFTYKFELELLYHFKFLKLFYPLFRNYLLLNTLDQNFLNRS